MVNRKKSKTKFHKRFIYIPAIIIGVILLALFPTLSALFEVNPPYNAGDFTVPELSIQEMQNNEDVNQMINGVIDDQIPLCGLSQTELDSIKECEELTKGEVLVNIDPQDFDPSLVITCGLTQNQVEECTIQIGNIIQDLQDQLIESENPLNDTEFSDDPPEQQLCDLTECPEASFVSLEATVTKVTSDGTRIETVELFDLPLQSIFVEDVTNLDFRNGLLEVALFAVTDPDVKLSGSGKLDLIIGGISVLQNPFDITIATGNNTDGRVQLLIGGTEKIIISIGNFFDKFPNNTLTPIQLKIIEIDMFDERNNLHKEDFVIFTLDIFRDDLLILILDEEGNPTISFPLDSRVVIHSSASKSEPYTVCTSKVETWSSIFQGNGRGCSLFTLVATSAGNCGSAIPTTTQVPAPTISASIADSKGTILSSGSGSGNSLFDYDQLTRNATYTLSITGVGSANLDYGEAQETKSFTCTQEGTPIIKSTSRISGNTSNCGTYYRTFYTTLSGLTLGSKMCNLP